MNLKIEKFSTGDGAGERGQAYAKEKKGEKRKRKNKKKNKSACETRLVIPRLLKSFLLDRPAVTTHRLRPAASAGATCRSTAVLSAHPQGESLHVAVSVSSVHPKNRHLIFVRTSSNTHFE